MTVVNRVLIVGGGIAGLAAASGLERADVECVIVEKAEAWRPVGAGIILNVNAMAALKMLGVDEEIRRRGLPLSGAAIRDQEWRSLARTDFAALNDEFGPTIAIHRAALHEALAEGARNAEVLHGVTLDEFTQDDDGVDVRLTNGREERFDLVVGADGVHSRVRELTFGEIPIEYTGYTCWRFVVDVQPDGPEMSEAWGRGKRFGVVPIGKDQVYVFAVANAPRDTPDPVGGRLSRLRTRFSDFGGPVPGLLESLKSDDQIIHNDLCYVSAGNWFDRRVVLIGDAAHAMSPNMGQGAGMALEDAAVLVALLTESSTVEEAFRKFRSRRASRVKWVQDQSLRIGKIGQLENRFACRTRSALIKAVPNRAGNRALRKLVSQPI